MLEATIRRYQNRTIEAAQVIAELIELAKQMREGQKRGAGRHALVQFSFRPAGDGCHCAAWRRAVLPVVRDGTIMARATSDHEQAIQDTEHQPD
jgi:hypothetical protein